MATDDVKGDQIEDAAAAAADSGEEDPQEALKKVISVEVSDVGVLRKGIKITVPQDSLNGEFDKEYDELVADATVPGFRRGHAPRKLVEKRFGREVSEQVQTRMLSNAYLAAIDKEEIKVLGDPSFWVTIKDKKRPEEKGEEKLVEMGEALRHIDLPESGDFTFRCEVEVKPEFDLPELEGVEVEKPKLTIDDADVQEQIDRVRARLGNWEPAPEGATVEADDLLVCDVKVTAGGEEIKTLDNVQLAARAQVVEGAVLSDFGDKLKGAKLGDVRTVEGDLPEDYEREALRGKKASFEFKLNDMKRMSLPPLDEGFLANLGFDSESEYREWTKSQMELQLEHEVRQGMRNQVRKYLLDNTKLELPEGLSSRQAARVAARQMIEYRRQGVPAAEIEKHADELRTGAQKQAVAELKLHFIMEDIAEKLEVAVSEEEVNSQIMAMARTYNRRFDRVRDELAKSNGIESLYYEIRDEKCIDAVLEKAKVTESEISKKDEKKKAPAKKKTTKKAEKTTEKSTEKKTTGKKTAKKTTKKKAGS